MGSAAEKEYQKREVEEIVMGENGHRNRSSLNLADLGT
jgi:hypothetical protein